MTVNVCFQGVLRQPEHRWHYSVSWVDKKELAS